MAETHLDNPGRIHFFKGYGPAPALGPCPHTDCKHNATSVIAWGPDRRRYELVACDEADGCAGDCRGWFDVSEDRTNRQRGVVHEWRLVGAQTPLPDDMRDIAFGVTTGGGA